MGRNAEAPWKSVEAVEKNGVAETILPPDPLDLANLRLDQDFAKTAGVKKALVMVPTRKPDKSWFFRVHPDEAYRLTTAVIEVKEDRETYLLSADLRSELSTESTFGIREIVTAINRQGVLFLWPLSLPGTDGKSNPWHQSAIEAAAMAKDKWVRVSANMSLGAYDIAYALGDLPEPVWPEHSFNDLIRIAFRERVITSVDHPVLRKLRGEI